MTLYLALFSFELRPLSSRRNEKDMKQEDMNDLNEMKNKEATLSITIQWERVTIPSCISHSLIWRKVIPNANRTETMNDAERLLSLLSIRPDWLAQCRQHLTNNPSLMSNTTAEQAIFSIFCHTDIISCCGDLPIIPDNIEVSSFWWCTASHLTFIPSFTFSQTLHKQRLFVSKPVILQVRTQLCWWRSIEISHQSLL